MKINEASDEEQTMSKDAYNIILKEKVVAIVRGFEPATVVNLAKACVDAVK